MVMTDKLCRIRQNRQSAYAEKIDLRQTDGLHVRMIELGDEKSLRRPLNRYHIGQWTGSDHHPTRVNTKVARLADNLVAVFYNFALSLVLHFGQ